MEKSRLDAEIKKIKKEFPAADDNKVRALAALIEQAAYEKLYLEQLNEKAMVTGLVKCHPDDPQMQKALPVSGEITRHAATLTNIMDKLMKYLAADVIDDDDGLSDYE